MSLDLINEAIELYRKGYSRKEVLDMIRLKYGKGVSYVSLTFNKLPDDIRREHLHNLLKRKYERYKRLYGEEEALRRVDTLKRAIEKAIGVEIYE